MLKFINLLCFFLIYSSLVAQKAFFYKNNAAELSKYSYFFMFNGYDITSPFINKNSLELNNNKYFILYNELSLKSLNIMLESKEEGTIFINLYEGSTFSYLAIIPKGYKKKKLKGRYLILDMIDGNDKSLIWRGWIDLKKLKANDERSLYQKAISLIMFNFSLEPTVIE